jgi:acyl carrier protein
MTNEEVREILVRTLGDVAGVLDNTDIGARLVRGENVRIAEMEIESLSVLDWGLAIERETGLEIDTAELKAFDTLDELAAHLAKRTP